MAGIFFFFILLYSKWNLLRPARASVSHFMSWFSIFASFMSAHNIVCMTCIANCELMNDIFCPGMERYWRLFSGCRCCCCCCAYLLNASLLNGSFVLFCPPARDLIGWSRWTGVCVYMLKSMISYGVVLDKAWGVYFKYTLRRHNLIRFMGIIIIIVIIIIINSIDIGQQQ